MKWVIKTVIFILLFNSCGEGTTTGNPLKRNVTLSSYNSASAMYLNKFLKLLIPSAHADLNSLTFCIKRMRFKLENSSGPGGSNIDLELGEVVIKPESTFLTSVEIQSATYRRVEIDLDSSCGSGNSVEIVNANGTFSTNDSITIRFEGTYDASDGDLTLFVQAIIDQVKNYNGGPSSIKDQLESTAGSM